MIGYTNINSSSSNSKLAAGSSDRVPPLADQMTEQELIRQKMPLLLGLMTSGESHGFSATGFSATPDSQPGDSQSGGSQSPNSQSPNSQSLRPRSASTSMDRRRGENPLDGSIRCAVISQINSRWETVYWNGNDFGPIQERSAHELASEALDKNEVIRDKEFSAVGFGGLDVLGPAADATARNQERATVAHSALLLSIDGQPAPAPLLRTLTVTLSRFLGLHQDRQTERRRLWQSTCMLQSAAVWQQLDDDEALLESIAKCACQVLDCERATIFLWDKARHRLIGRPAIGVEGGVLEVEDDAGIVGEVLQNGEPRWWSTGGIDGERVNRRIDQAQNFQTRSLVAVPLLNTREQIIGVFEGINANDSDHRKGTFDAADVRTLTELAVHAAVAIDTQRTRMSLTRTRDRLVSQAADSNRLIGEHDLIRDLRTNATKVAPTDLSVLILGKNGTGKEVLAQHIHYQSERRNGPFVAVNCAALVETLLESELFGHEKGAFTDAAGTRQGKFELASGGTLFLDEVGDMSPGGQAKLLRVLEERVVVRVGGSQPIPVDVRVIAATNQPLQEMIQSKRFREDLFFRLNVVSLTLPPLMSRGNDVILLAEHFMKHFCEKIGRVVPVLDSTAKRAIVAHTWPGNVRELRNTIERLCYLTSGQTVGAQDLMLQSTGDLGSGTVSVGAGGGAVFDEDLDPNLNEATRLFQINHIESVIAYRGGNMTEAAATLGVHRSNLYRKMRQLGMSTSENSERPEHSVKPGHSEKPGHSIKPDGFGSPGRSRNSDGTSGEQRS